MTDSTAANANQGQDLQLNEMLEIAAAINNIMLLYADWKLIEEYKQSREYFL